MTFACGNRIPIAKKWDGPIYRDVSRMATQISGFDDPEPVFLSPRRLPQRRPIQVRQPRSPMWDHSAGQDVDVPGRYRGDAMEHRINHSPVRGQRVVAGSIPRATLSARHSGQRRSDPGLPGKRSFRTRTHHHCPARPELRPVGSSRFVEHRVGDPRLISLIRRWSKN